MNRILLVTYDLKSPTRQYQKLFEAIKEISPEWCHYISNMWLIYTNKTPDQIVANLKPYLSKKDFLFVTKITRMNQGLLPEKAWDWINSKEPD
jgi:hypothetical protein